MIDTRGARRRATPSALLLTGFVTGALVAGLVVPFAIGSDERDEVAATAGAARGTDPGSGTDLGGTVVSPEDAAGGVPGPGSAQSLPQDVGGSTPAGGGSAGTTPPASGGQPVSQQGVSATEILVGIPVINLNDVGDAAGLNVVSFDERGAWQAFIDVVNAEPIHGRKLKPVYVPYNPLDTADTLRACAVLTEDHKVFAVLAYSFFGDAGPCVSVQHRTLMLNYTGYFDEQYRDSEGRLFSQQFGSHRTNRFWALEMHRLGILTGQKLGVVMAKAGNGHVPVEEELLPALRRLGHDVARVTTLDADFAIAQGQIPLEVAQMRQAGVQKIVFAANELPLARFAQEADRQGWHPEYLVSDYASGLGEFLTSSYPASFQGLGTTGQRFGEHRTGAQEATRDAWCRATYEQATGKTAPRGSSAYPVILQICSVVTDMFAAGARAAGPALTTESFSAAEQGLGPLDIAFASGGSFRPGKFDAMDEIRTVRFRQDCRCWIPVDDFHAAPA